MMKTFFYCSFFFALLVFGCHKKETGGEEEEVAPDQIQTPVTVTSIQYGPLTEYIDLNATASFIQTSVIKSSANGYITKVNIRQGEQVSAGQTAFILKTKEAQALGNSINALDSSFHFSGVISIRVHQHGFIAELSHQVGDYVQDGDQLALISDTKGFGFLLNLPYELRRYVSLNKSVQVILPDSTVLDGVVSSFMPTVDSVSQTQAVLIKVNGSASIPQNLIAKVRVVKNAKLNAVTLPKEAVLTDEAQSHFWVMKMLDSTTAVKTEITKGLEVNDRVEIIAPSFAPSDKILTSGNYGLADTAKVRVMK
ncbi:MAG TPA: HlyD family efflux transporter periplasmic adaptor subunit [Parafilimonas sp.]|nr:HlyD family efflux transporter periplasmic adaptor subunit [Parafilimonas sp.]